METILDPNAIVKDHRKELVATVIIEGSPIWAQTKGQIHRQDMLPKAQAWFDIVRKNLIPSRDVLDVPWEIANVVAQIMEELNISVHEIMADQIRQAPLCNEGPLPYQAMITCPCHKVGCIFIKGDRRVHSL